jgi:hypothetical protein
MAVKAIEPLKRDLKDMGEFLFHRHTRVLPRRLSIDSLADYIRRERLRRRLGY